MSSAMQEFEQWWAMYVLSNNQGVSKCAANKVWQYAYKAGYLSGSDSGFKAGVNSYSVLHEMQDLIQRTIDFALDVPECGCSYDACSSCARHKEAQGLVSELKTYLEG